MVRTLMGHVNRPVNASTALLASTALESGTLGYGSVSRSGTTATYTDAYGVVREAPANTPRVNNSEYLATNYLTNPRGAGALVGGAFPTGWSVNGPGMQFAVAGIGVEDGIDYVDIRITGVPTGATPTYLAISTLSGGVSPAVAGEQWTYSFYYKIMSSNTTFAYYYSIMRQKTAAFGVLNDHLQVFPHYNAPTPLSKCLASNTFTLNNSDTRAIEPFFQFGIPTIGAVPVDITIRVGWQKLERGTGTTTFAVPRPGQTGASVAYIKPRLLLEEGRTNYIRNPRGEGGTVGTLGSGGLPPTHWLVSAGGNGLAVDCLGTYTQFGMTWTRFRFYGTATSTNANAIRFEDGVGITGLAAGDKVTTTFYLRQSAGNWPHNFAHWGPVRDSIPSHVQDNQQPILNATTYGLTRQSRTETVPATGTPPYTMPWHAVIFYPVISQTYDVTIDIAAPQVEFGAFATSVILPAVGAPTAAVRNNDNITIPLTEFAKFGTPVTNSILQSNTFSDSAWTKAGSSVLASAGTSPFNTADAWRVTLTAANSGLIQSVDIPNNTTVTFSFYAKAETVTSIGPQFYDRNGQYRGCTVDLNTGVVSGTFGVGMSFNAVSVGSGWYRISATGNTNAGGTVPSFRIVGNGTGAETLLLWGAQVETSPLAIPANILTGGELFNSGWTWQAAALTFNAIANPIDGTVNGTKLVEDATALSIHGIQSASLPGYVVGQWYTWSIYARAAERNWLRLVPNNGAGTAAAWFDLSTGKLGNVDSWINASIQPAGNGWYRCSTTFQATSAAAVAMLIRCVDANGAANTNGVLGWGLHIYGSVVEQGQYASAYVPLASSTTQAQLVSPYIATTGTTVTKTKLAPGTVVVRWKVPAGFHSGGAQGVVAISDGTNLNRIGMRHATNTSVEMYVSINGTTSLLNPGSAGASGAMAKAAMAWSGSNTSYSMNGAAPAIVYAQTPLGMTNLALGVSFTNSFYLNSEIESVTYYPYAMSDAQLQAATA